MLNNNFIKSTALFILLVLLQVAVLNKISFFSYATPFIYIYFIIKLPIGLNKNFTLLLGFLLGMVIDIFCNTPGINASATTLAAFIRQPSQNLFFLVDDYEGQTPKLSTLRGAFIKYVLIIILVHHATLISLESFSYINIKLILLRILLSSALTFILIYAFEGFSLKKKNSE